MLNLVYKLIIAILLLATAIPAPAVSSPLVITHSSGMPPLSFINSNGDADGIIIDLWKEWSKHSGIEVSFDLKDWPGVLSAAITGQADIIGGLFYSKERAEKLVYGDYLFHMKGALFASKKIIEKNGLNMQETVCGVLKGGYGKDFMQKVYPYTPLMIFNSIEDMFKLVAEGRLKTFVVDLPVGAYQLNHLGLDDSFECIREMYTRELYPASGYSKSGLIKTINKYMAAIPKKEKEYIIEKWLNRPEKYFPEAGMLIVISFFLITALAALNRLKNTPYFPEDGERS
ncbi:transporter substrate-binding domain-containing protein [Maridesulfovibrio sp.]|uniref:transporter substrate-binding domain-containing protein n=1 Tax=Maridesulfovibrio sp. TaxID=2795000 RepID=UPI002A186DAA|nr:transporter substrate-binding domain-containing protein [Maridesulfovibrio sp.]